MKGQAIEWGGGDLQATDLTSDLCPEYLKNFQNLTLKKHTIQLENGKKKKKKTCRDN